MDINEVKKLHTALEHTIYNQIATFNKVTGLFVNDVELQVSTFDILNDEGKATRHLHGIKVHVSLGE